MSAKTAGINSGRAVMAISYYVPGRKPQYGAPRWERYESLRVSGFSKYEARALSKIRMGDALDVVVGMTKTRQSLIRRATKEGWSRYQYYVAVRTFYRRNNLTSVLKPDGTRVAKKAGRSDVFVWFHRQERKMARQRGWRKGGLDVSRRPKKKTDPRKGVRKGDIKAQRKRAVQRAMAHKGAGAVTSFISWCRRCKGFTTFRHYKGETFRCEQCDLRSDKSAPRGKPR